MKELLKANPWVWVLVQDPAGNEQFLGQHDEEKDISFIPVFFDKEQALQCLKHLARDEALEYEVQAIKYEELASHSAKNGFLLFFLNEAGEVLERIRP